MSNLALPPHLRGRKHTDWPWPFNKISRGWNAYGPRTSGEDYRSWPPKLIAGQGVARWETARGDSIIFIPALATIKVSGSRVYGREWDVIEMNPSKPDFMEKKKVLIPEWAPSKVYDTQSTDGTWTQHCEPDVYSPSALQKFSWKGWMKLSPSYACSWSVITKRELPIWPEGGEDTVLFIRRGYRPDHADLYYNRDRIAPIGYVGLHWE